MGNILLLYSCSCRVRARSVPGCLSTQLQPSTWGDAEMGLLFPKGPSGTGLCSDEDASPSLSVAPTCSPCSPWPFPQFKECSSLLGPQDLQNTLALLQSITDFSSAFQAVGDSACFNPSLKSKLLEILTVSA